ncbi:uncharacterized protein MONOS_7588 [Monocercomonoides exilis]|uniref:uncharacterized protein n=1 Tax=Monocercomonoides exilis TaxID=2049356 RepID=UPI003559D8DF|nr:hypothetical protein MONOS_7588 [Monocercomonoides exilis]|eukprot:MONOS_7588.1-p1 / transcript=MONOS_7588.1 / gene=MONOS_7588 / organism=Monocercomonoides_exilis_PA203 / gene_product=unspecified product / transcript_product=unspecified product / location=Mono_scaffold00263:2714-15397(-) / protein_length=3848 / sequence_SO=supercontig / SO=protein_coding / is_pseudo=false
MLANSSIYFHTIAIRTHFSGMPALNAERSILFLSNCLLEMFGKEYYSPICCGQSGVAMNNISAINNGNCNVLPCLVSTTTAQEKSKIDVGFVEMASSIFSDIVMSSTSPFVGSELFSQVDVHMCEFMNITARQKPVFAAKSILKQTLQKNVVSGCLFSNCANTFDGVIVGAERGSGFVSMNTTFSEAKNSYKDQPFTSPLPSFISGDIVFVGCTFTNCSSSDRNGGAISVTGSANLNVTDCSFSDCRARNDKDSYTRGGAIYQNNQLEGIIVNTNFSKCYVNMTTDSFGGAICHSGAVSLTIPLGTSILLIKVTSDCIKYSFSRSNKSNRVTTNVDRSEWLPDPNASPDPILVNSAKSGGDHNDCGGTDDECRTIGFAMNQWVSFKHHSIRLVSECFEETEIEVGGRSVLLKKSDGLDRVNISSHTESESLFFVEYGSLEMELFTLIHSSSISNNSFLFQVTGMFGFVHLDKCVITSDVPDGIFNRPFLSAEEGRISLDDCEVKNIVFSDCCLLSTSNCGEICVHGGNITEIVRKVGDGALILKIFKGEERLEWKNTTVSGCRCLNGNGGMAALSLAEGSQLSIGKGGLTTAMRNCVANDGEGNAQNGKGRGGCIYLKLTNAADDFVISNPGFENNSALFGKDVYVCSPNLKASVTRERIAYYSSLFSVDEAMGTDEGTPEVVIPLVYCLRERGERVNVGSNGVDVGVCGFEDYPCKTMQFSLAQQEKVHKLTIASSYSLLECLSLRGDEEYSISGVSGKPEISVVGNGSEQSGVIEVMSDVGISLVSLSLEAWLQSSQTAVFVVGEEVEGSLQISSSLVKGSSSVSEIGYSLIAVKNGKAELNDVEVGSLTFKEPMIICAQMGTKVKAVNLVCTDVLSAESGLIKAESDSELLISGSKFESTGRNKGSVININKARNSIVNRTIFSGCLLSSGDGGAIQGVIGQGQKLEVEGGEMNVVCEKGNGGGMKIVMEKDSIFYVGIEGLAKLKGCQAGMIGDKGGYGGGIWLDCVKSTGNFRLKNVEFAGCVANKCGKNMFVKTEKMGNVIDSTRIGFGPDLLKEDEIAGTEKEDEVYVIPLVLFLREDVSEVAVGGANKKDFSRCGYAGYPCETVQYGIAQWKKASGISLKISESGILGSELLLASGSSTFRGAELEARLDVYENITVNQSAMIEVSSNCLFESLFFVVPESLNGREWLMKMSTETLNLTNCQYSVRSASFVSVGLVLCVGGKMEICGLSVNEVEFRLHPLMRIEEEAECNMNESILNGVITNGEVSVIELHSSGLLTLAKTTMSGKKDRASGGGMICDVNGKTLTVEDCSFCGICMSMQNGSTLNGNIGDENSVVVRNSTFDDCSANDGCGGGIMVTLSGEGMLRIGEEGERMDVKKCNARDLSKEKEGRGYGGGVFVRIVEEAYDVILRSFSFGQGEERNGADNGGNNIFVEANELKKIATDTVFDFSFAKSEEEMPNLKDMMGFEGGNKSQAIPLVLLFRNFSSPAFVGNDGINGKLCGFSDYPCADVLFAGKTIFGQGSAIIRLLPQYEITNQLRFEEQEMKIDVEEIGVEVVIASNGSINGEGFIETRSATTFGKMMFSVPSSMPDSKSALFVCFSSSLVMNNVSFIARTNVVSFSLVKVVGGESSLVGVKVRDVKFSINSFLVIQGNGTSAQLNGMELKGVNGEDVCGLIHVNSGGSISIVNSSEKGAGMKNGAVLCFDGSCGIQLRNNSVTAVSREVGSGGGVVGRAGEGKVVDMKECSFETIVCAEEGAKGGGLVVHVEKGGTLKFEGNSVKFNEVSESGGYGGGMFLELEDTDLSYSMQKNRFGENKALLGRDVYVACEDVRRMLNEILWEGSVNEEDERERFWVYDGSVEPAINVSILVILFPESPKIMFVDGAKVNKKECGFEETPCKDVGYAFSLMNDSHSTIRVIGNTTLDADIARNSSLAIQGRGLTKPVIGVGGGGHITLVSSPIFLSIRSLSFELPATPTTAGYEEFLKIEGGQCLISECVFGVENGIESGIEKESCVWIVKETDGKLDIKSVSVVGIGFQMRKGIADVERGVISLSEVEIKGVSTEGKSLIYGGEGAEIVLSNVRASGCSIENGHLLEAKKARNVEIVNESCFEGWGVSVVNGGMMWCELGGDDKLLMKNSTVRNWSVDGEDGRGGGVYLHIGNDSSNNFVFENLLFSENSAREGKDMFVFCKALNISVSPIRFCFVAENGEEGSESDLWGIDESHYFEPVNLRLFLVQPHSECVYLSVEGYDAIGCGLEEHACQTLWRGVQNIKSGKDNSEIVILEKAHVKDGSDVSGIRIRSAQDEVHSSLLFEEKGEFNGDGAIVNSKKSEFVFVDFVFPHSLRNGVKALILSESTNGDMNMSNCIFECSQQETVEFAMLEMNGGEVTLDWCSFKGKMVFGSQPLKLAGTVRMNNCSFQAVASAQNGKGGLANVILENEAELQVKNCTIQKCECLTEGGRGGGLFIDCKKSKIARSVLFGAVIFEGNKADVGENLFVESFDLNSTVTTDTFDFDFESLKSNSNGFVGSDKVFNETDLFRFVVGYRSERIYVSDEGHDVARCGSAEDPCQSWWKGVRQMSEGADKRWIFILGKVELNEVFEMTDCSIEAWDPVEDEVSKVKIMIENDVNESRKACLWNKNTARIARVEFEMEGEYDNEEKAVILSENGSLSLVNCSIEGLAEKRIQMLVSFVCVREGVLEITNFDVSNLNCEKSLLVVSGRCESRIVELVIKGLSLNEGSVIEVEGASRSKQEQAKSMKSSPTILLEKCHVKDVKKDVGGACVIDSSANKESLKLVANRSAFDECRSSNSEEGGAILFVLKREGSLRIEESTLNQCGCSTAKGRGGGIYVDAAVSGDLDMQFVKDGFDSNVARVGRDLFVKCVDIKKQINETQFNLDLREGSYNRYNAIYGMDETEFVDEPMNLIEFIVTYQNDVIFVTSNISKGSEDSKNCGTQKQPCATLEYALQHLSYEFNSQLVIIEEGRISAELELCNVTISSRSEQHAKVGVTSGIHESAESLLSCTDKVLLTRLFVLFESSFAMAHGSFLRSEAGVAQIVSCSFSCEETTRNDESDLLLILLSATGNGSLSMEEVNITRFSFVSQLIVVESNACLKCSSISIQDVSCRKGLMCLSSHGKVTLEKMEMSNVLSNEGSAIQVHSSDIDRNGDEEERTEIETSQLVCENISVPLTSSVIACDELKNSFVKIENSSFVSYSSSPERGSLVMMSACRKVSMNLCKFGVNRQAFDVIVNDEGEDICEWNGSLVDFGECHVVLKDTTVENSSEGGLSISGGQVMIEEGWFMNNNPMIGKYPSIRRNIICSDDATVNVVSLKGGDGAKENSSLWMLNKGCKAEGTLEGLKSVLFIPVLDSVSMAEEGAVMSLSFRGALFIPCKLGFEIVTRMGSTKLIEKWEFSEGDFGSETEVHSSISSAMITSSPDESEVAAAIIFGEKNAETDLFVLKNRKREAEKKNEERIKKRVYEKSLGHSESSEHLLSESGSTEYILGRDSDKIPDWALEKEEEEEIRKRSPSPSISSTSTTSTTDSDSTFVRSECLCPTTSSMSNLVDAMACSSPHEKLIVDLRDSLFMLLHGRNEKKEMAIGTLEEREVTAAQIMFWVANGVLHCFDELKVALQSLDGLSPHIVLFSEHMVICIAMHSDCSTDSDSSSISSSTTVVTSASDDEEDSLPSSAFEDEDEFKKECLRWKAPELVSGAKKHATKKTVVFSIGMMVWECVTLKMPFGEYDGSGAGELIVEGVRPSMEMMEGSRLSGCVKECVLQKGRERPELGRLKREFFGYFPSGATMVTATDAIGLYEGSDVFYGSGGICSSSSSDSGSTCTEMGG